LDYGVFGLASPAEAPAPKPGPALAPRAEGAPKPMPAPARRFAPVPSSRRAPQAAALAERDAPAEKPAPLAPVARDPIPAPSPFKARLAPGAPAPESAPAFEPAPASDPAPKTAAARAGVGVVIIGAGGEAQKTIGSIEAEAGKDAQSVVFVAQASDSDGAAAARGAGLDVIEIADRALSPGRARNAGYRQAMKLNPGLAYVQFVETGFILDADWLRAAEAFMARRPEVAMVEGWIGERPADGRFEPGEIHATGATTLVRAAAFEAAGGFRGDLPVNETIDLCIRLRRRGAHVWRLNAPMGRQEGQAKNPAAWWSAKTRAGYRHAHGAALHGEPPEMLFMRERSRALVWGGLLPALILTGAVVAAALARAMFPLVNPALAAGGVLLFGASLYLARIVAIMLTGGGAKGGAVMTTLACFPEFVGAWRYYFGGAQARRLTRRTA
ncbi:MAG: hypothetical protein AB7P23_04210, partial [Amphiplicatus sp.]